MLKLLNENIGNFEMTDIDFISHTLDKLAKEIEINSVQKRDYNNLLSSIFIYFFYQNLVDPAELINEIANKENILLETIQMASIFLIFH